MRRQEKINSDHNDYYFGTRLTCPGGKQNKQVTNSKERKGTC